MRTCECAGAAPQGCCLRHASRPNQPQEQQRVRSGRAAAPAPPLPPRAFILAGELPSGPPTTVMPVSLMEPLKGTCSSSSASSSSLSASGRRAGCGGSFGRTGGACGAGPEFCRVALLSARHRVNACLEGATWHALAAASTPSAAAQGSTRASREQRVELWLQQRPSAPAHGDSRSCTHLAARPARRWAPPAAGARA